MTDLETLNADQLRALHVRTTSDVLRRAIKRRLQQLADQPPAPPPPPKGPQMKNAEYRSRLLALRQPTTRPWWSLEQITDALDRCTAEANDKKEGK